LFSMVYKRVTWCRIVSLHDALPIFGARLLRRAAGAGRRRAMSHLPTPEWRVSPDLTDNPAALADMERRAAAIHAGDAGERIWLRSEEHTSELQSRVKLVCRRYLEQK